MVKVILTQFGRKVRRGLDFQQGENDIYLLVHEPTRSLYAYLPNNVHVDNEMYAGGFSPVKREVIGGSGSISCVESAIEQLEKDIGQEGSISVTTSNGREVLAGRTNIHVEGEEMEVFQVVIRGGDHPVKFSAAYLPENIHWADYLTLHMLGIFMAQSLVYLGDD